VFFSSFVWSASFSMSVISRSANFPGNTHVSDSSSAASGAWSYRFVSKRKAIYPRVIHAVPGDHPERCPKFRDISTSSRAPKRVRPGCRSIAYAVHRLRAPFVRVIIVALFDSNLVLGSFVLIYWTATACSVIAGTYVLCAELRVYSCSLYTWFTYQSRDLCSMHRRKCQTFSSAFIAVVAILFI